MQNNFESAKERLTDYLTEKKMSKTATRYAILEFIYSLDKSFNAEFLYEGMKARYYVSYATIYNTLIILLDCNLIIKYQYDNSLSQYYEKAHNTAFHHLLICSMCGSIKEFTDVRLRNTIHAKLFKGFKANKHTLSIYGTCSKCTQKKKKSTK